MCHLTEKTVDYNKATRSFFAELKMNSSGIENFGPIIDKQGKLSTSLKQSSENWKAFTLNYIKVLIRHNVGTTMLKTL